jgi:L-histidine N-alpha-methyltransferase
MKTGVAGCYIGSMSKPSDPPREPYFLELHAIDHEATRVELVAGLTRAEAVIAPKFLYDPLGSRLFDAITELREYYPTRTEAAILRAHGTEVARACGTGRTLIDLGAGNCEKAGNLFASLKPERYVAVDISAQFLRRSLQVLQREYPQVDMLGLGMDFSSRLGLPPEVGSGPRTFFYPGSSIGNFAPPAAAAFLRQIHAAAKGGNLLIGVDLLKPAAILEAAYADALGVTAAFNLNLLDHVNSLLGADFVTSEWTHVAVFNKALSRIEMHLQARREHLVRWPGGQRRFAAGERIHTESSYKYGIEAFDTMLREAGFHGTRCWTDEQRWFAVFSAQA